MLETTIARQIQFLAWFSWLFESSINESLYFRILVMKQSSFKKKDRKDIIWEIPSPPKDEVTVQLLQILRDPNGVERALQRIIDIVSI